MLGKKKTALFLSVMLVLMSLLSGCGGQKNSENAKNKPIVIRFSQLDSANTKLEIEEIAKGIKEIMPNVTVQYEPLTGDYTQKILMQASSKTLPDVIWISDNMVPMLASKNLFEPLDSYMIEAGLKQEDFFEAMIKLGKYDGKQYMIPKDYSHVVVQYNKALFDEIGVPYPKNDWTWAEFKETAKKFVKKSDNLYTQSGAVIQLGWTATMFPMIMGMGGSIVDETYTKANINTPQSIAAFKELKQLVDDGVIVNELKPGFLDFSSGKVAMNFHVRPVSSNITKRFGNDGWDVVTFPKMPVNALVGAGTSGYAVNKDSKYKAEAAKAVMYLVSKAGQEMYAKTGDAVPVLKELANSNFWKVLPNAGHNFEAYTAFPERDMLSLENSLKNVSAVSKFQEVIKKLYENIFLNLGSVEDSLKESQNSLDVILK